MLEHPSVQINGTPRAGSGATRTTVFYSMGMVAPHIEEWFVQRADDILKVVVRQVPTGYHQLDIRKPRANSRAVDKVKYLVANR